MKRAAANEVAAQVELSIMTLRTLERQASTAVAGLGISLDAWRALRLIAESPGCSMKDLVDLLSLPPATATRTVDSLVARSLVHRRVSDDDRRSVVVFPTDSSAEVIDEANVVIAEAVNPITAVT